MFIVLMKYIQPIETIDQYLIPHRAHLDRGYQKNLLIVSGPQIPRTGGVLISQCSDRAELESFLQEDPFICNQIAEYELIEFDPIKYHPNFVEFV